MGSQEGTAFLDLIIATLQEHEKALSLVVDKLERLVSKVNKIPAGAPKEYVVRVNPEGSDFTDKVCGHLLNLPKGFNFEIPKIDHVAYVKITFTEPTAGTQADIKNWEKVFKDEDPAV